MLNSKYTCSPKKNNWLVLIVLALVVSQSIAQHTMQSYSVNSGGSKSTSASYQLTASISQVDASSKLISTKYTLEGGFWHQNEDLIFRNGFK